MTKTRLSLLLPRLFSLIALSFLLSACVPGSSGNWKTNQSTTGQPSMDAQQNGQAGKSFAELPPVNVAILLPLTGDKADIGQSLLQAAQLALFDIGYDHFNLMPRDTQGTAAGAKAAANAALKDGAQLILGPVFAHSVSAVKEVAAPRGVNVIAFSTDWTLADRSTFLMGFMPFSQVDRVTKYAASKGFNNFAMIAPRDQYGEAVATRFVKSVRENGGELSPTLRYNPGDPEVINDIAKMVPQGGKPSFQAVFMPVGGPQIEIVSSALSYNKMMPSQIKRLGTGLWDDPRIAKQPNMQGAWFAAPAPRAREGFERQYYSTYGQKPARIATLAYDATALAAILAKNGFDQGLGRPAFDYASLTKPSGFAGTDGIFRFHPNGLVERGLAVLEFRGGNIVEVSPAPQSF